MIIKFISQKKEHHHHIAMSANADIS